MRTAEQGDRVQVHYRKRFDDGSWASSQRRGPVELTVGVEHPRLPGLGMTLVGMAPGQVTKLRVGPEKAYGVADPKKVRSVPRSRLPDAGKIEVGDRVRMLKENGRGHQVLILELGDGDALVDANHRWAGMTMELEVELVGIQGADGARAESAGI